MDKNLFEELYLGNYVPSDDVGKSQECLDNANKLGEIKDKLVKKLTGECLELFLQYDDLAVEIVCSNSSDAYSQGVKFATNFLYNALSGKDSGKK